ncbi:MAG: HlyC/CorC family transporter [Deltaproteobacteria bacterium]|nr:HlyC/CorC family transporter [Deltaproteobacteria bacterium]
MATEFAIVKVRPTRIEELNRQGRPGSTTARRIIANLDAYLSATQLGITLASLGLGWIGEPAFARIIEPVLAWFGIVDQVWVHRIALASAFGLITVLHIVLGELTPKSLAILRSESVALSVAYPMRLFYVLFYPFIFSLNKLATIVLHLCRLAPTKNLNDGHSEEEIRIILSQARSAGLLEPSRAALLSKALSLPTKTARHLMIPRSEVNILDANLNWQSNLTRAMEAGHTRFPLCERELDDVIGIIDIRRALFSCQSNSEVDLRMIATSPVYLPEMMSAERVLSELRAHNVKMAIVVDEYGSASGIVTAADVVIAVMGEFNNNDTMEVVSLPGGAFEVEGVATLEEVEENLHIGLASESSHTLAGYLMERIGRLPRAGDRVVQQGYIFDIIDVSGPRVQKIRIQRESNEVRSISNTTNLSVKKTETSHQSDVKITDQQPNNPSQNDKEQRR